MMHPVRSVLPKHYCHGNRPASNALSVFLLLLLLLETTLVSDVEANGAFWRRAPPASASRKSTTTTSTYQLTVLHINDFHARFEETNESSGKCGSADRKVGKCFGGIARIASIVKRERSNKTQNTIFLDGGDQFQGTIWYSFFKWNSTAHFMNMLNIDAFALGNHEFDDGVEGVVPLLDALNCPVVSSNIDSSLEPTMIGMYTSSVVLDVGGKRIGIIGHTTSETSNISNAGKLKFSDEVEAVAKEAAALTSQGVKILIALGHSGYDVDMKMAANVPEIDFVVGAHSHTFLYPENKTPPSSEKPSGPYPTIITQSNGKRVPVVQAYAYSKYIGKMILDFNDEGDLLSWTGEPILLDSSVEPDPVFAREMENWSVSVSEKENEIIGSTFVFLEGSTPCYSAECSLGNLVADSMVYWYVPKRAADQWTSVSLALIQAGGLRTSISDVSNEGNITYGDMITVLPFENPVDVVQLYGKTIKKVFERSVSVLYSENYSRAFLQVSGFKVLFDYRKPPWNRVVHILVKCTNCTVPDYEMMDPEGRYWVAVPSFLAKGGDGFEEFVNERLDYKAGSGIDAEILQHYLMEKGPVIQGLEERLIILDGLESSGLKQKSSLSLQLCALIVTTLVFLTSRFN